VLGASFPVAQGQRRRTSSRAGAATRGQEFRFRHLDLHDHGGALGAGVIGIDISPVSIQVANARARINVGALLGAE
jgi:hypothetical protein